MARQLTYEQRIALINKWKNPRVLPNSSGWSAPSAW